MKVACRNAVLGAAALAVLLAFGGTAEAQNKCHAGKMKCVSKKKSCILGVQGKGRKKGLPPDAAKLQKCKDKYDGGTAPAKGCFAKLEAKNDGPCPTFGDTAAFEAKVDAFVADVLTELDPPGGPALNKCLAGKIKCVTNKDKCILKVHEKAAKTGLPPDAAKLQKCKDKFDGGTDPTKGCFAKLETKNDGPCETFGDTAALEAKIDAFDADVLAELDPAPACPTKIKFTGTSTNGVLDTGWTGQGHDSTVISDGTVTVSVLSCAGAVPPCGVCTYSGPIANNVGELRVRRCAGDSSIVCTTDGDCGGNAPCKFFFGTYLPLAAGGVSTCVENTFSGGISGTANIDTGTSAGLANLTSRVFSGPTLSNPCPRCIGDGVVNDNVAGGTCSGGLHSGDPCDTSGSSPNASFGSTSLDCPPLSGGVIATLPIDLSNTTGVKTRTLSAASPSCRAIGHTAKKCQCDTCNNAAATPCSSNADCTAVGATICGGLRCAGGPNNGTACALSSECPSGACTRPGAATAENQCDAVDDCVADAGTPSPNDRICATGPFEQFCSPTETFRGCFVDGDCPFAGDTCSLGKNRDCFDNGNVGDVVLATGNPDPPVGHQSDPTLAALFCIGPTSSAAVNSAAGLPGLGRLELVGHAIDNGTP